LAIKLNAVNNLTADARREELQILSSLFGQLTATAIPVKLYNTLRSRFHPIVNDNRKSKKAESYSNIKDLSKNSPVLAQILFDHYNEISNDDAALCKEYCLRMLYYGKASKLEAFDKLYYNVFKKLQATNPAVFCELFDQSKVSFKFFENLHIKKLYCDACGSK